MNALEITQATQLTEQLEKLNKNLETIAKIMLVDATTNLNVVIMEKGFVAQQMTKPLAKELAEISQELHTL